MTSRQGALLGLSLLLMALVSTVVHLSFSAAQGVHTAEEGRRDRADSLARDTTLAARIEALEAQLQPGDCYEQ